MDVRKIAVLGAGLMGHGIAQVAALSGFDVILIDVDDARVERGLANIRKSLDRMVKADRVARQESESTLERIEAGTDRSAVSRADFVIEAVTENEELKRQLFAELDRLCRPEVVLASNTSQFPITSLAAATQHPQRVCGMHFFNPPQLMRLVEIARAVQTDDETVQEVERVAQLMGKETVLSKDSQGFITSRLIAAFLNEAMRLLEEGVAGREDIDMACRLAFNHPMGPFQLLDLTGLDTILYVLESLTDAFGDRFRPTQSHRNLVRAGRLGRKSGRGIYDYPET